MACQCAPGLMALKRYADAKIGNQFWGCVGDSNHTYGYHLCYPPAGDYSLTQPRDRGRAGYACAYDLALGWKDSRKWFAWFVQRLKERRYPDVCELIGSYDGRRVLYFRGPSFETQNYTGSGHDTWCHISVWRDSAHRDHSYILRDWFEERDGRGEEEDEPMIFFCSVQGKPGVFASENGMTLRWLSSSAYNNMKLQSANGLIKVWQGGNAIVSEPTRDELLAKWGVLIGKDPGTDQW
jgi:hypothetical protein